MLFLNPFSRMSDRQIRNTIKVFWIFLLISGTGTHKASRALQNRYLYELFNTSCIGVLFMFVFGEGGVLLILPVLTYLAFRWRRKFNNEKND